MVHCPAGWVKQSGKRNACRIRLDPASLLVLSTEPDAFLTFAITNPANRDQLIETIAEVYRKAIDEGFTDKELEDAVTSYKPATNQLQETG